MDNLSSKVFLIFPFLFFHFFFRLLFHLDFTTSKASVSKLSITRGYSRFLLYQLKRKLYSYFDKSISGSSIVSQYTLDPVQNRIVAANIFTNFYELLFGVFHEEIKLREFHSILNDINELEMLSDGISDSDFNSQVNISVSISSTVMRLRTTYQCFNRWA